MSLIHMLIGVAIVVFVTMPANCSFDTFRLIGDAIAFDCTNRSLPYPSATLFMVPATDVVAGFVVGGVLGYGVQELLKKLAK